MNTWTQWGEMVPIQVKANDKEELNPSGEKELNLNGHADHWMLSGDLSPGQTQGNIHNFNGQGW